VITVETIIGKRTSEIRKLFVEWVLNEAPNAVIIPHISAEARHIKKPEAVIPPDITDSNSTDIFFFSFYLCSFPGLQI
jgi:hypothetical protein